MIASRGEEDLGLSPQQAEDWGDGQEGCEQAAAVDSMGSLDQGHWH